MADDRPHVRIDPAIQSGDPVVKGVSVETIADHVWIGEGVDEVARDYGFTRSDILVACWYMGTRGWRRRWGSWAGAVHPAPWRAKADYDAIPDPPTRDEARP